MYHYLPHCDAQKLKKSGFEVGAYEYALELGRTYYFDEDDYVIGGKATSIDKMQYSHHDQLAATGYWLPSDSHLWRWLQLNHIDVTLKWDHQEEVFFVTGIDNTSAEKYHGCNINLLYALFKLIYKICKSGKHKFNSCEVLNFHLPEFHVTYDQMVKLKTVGFSFPDFEHDLSGGMVYYYEGNCYVIGGPWRGKFTQQDQLVAKLGHWLPDDSLLWDWLYRNEFDVTYHWSDADQRFYLFAIDSIDNQQYSAVGEVLVYTLSELVYKICQSSIRCYTPERNLRLEILQE